MKKPLKENKVLQKSRKEKSVFSGLKSDIEKLGGFFEKVEWYKTGWPDGLAGLPGGHFWLVETKRPVGGHLSPRQIVVHRELRKLDFKVRVVSDNESKQIFLNEIRNALGKFNS